MTNLYLKYRPQTFKEVFGNEMLLSTLDTMLEDIDSCPHVFLLHGPTGCGKTTIARIIADRLGCVGTDYHELDSAQFRGIDTVREIRKQAMYFPVEGPVTVWIVDECFPENTQIMLSNGKTKAIKNINAGDSIINIQGKDEVVDTFSTEMPLNRIVSVNLENGKNIICSEDHLFLTQDGWTKAKDLKNNFVFLKNFHKFVGDINSPKIIKNEKNSKNNNSRMSHMQKIISNKKKSTNYNLWESMWEYFGRTKQSGDNSIGGDKKENIRKKEKIFTNGTRENTNTKVSTKNEETQSIPRQKSSGKDDANKKNKWHFTYLERCKRWKWNIYNSSKNVSNSFRLGNGSGNKNISSTKERRAVSSLLQSRYRKQKIKISNRSRWRGTQFEKEQIFGQQERQEITGIRVESIAYYKQGNNDRYFHSIISDKERNKGFVTFYDLQVKNHPSYLANNIIVHNCHKLTNDAQNALLKILEDTPKHVYFILSTTDPQKLIKTVRGRCIEFKVEALTENQMKRLFRRVLKKENAIIEQEIQEQIIQDSFGYPRNALQILEQVLRVPPEKQLEIATKSAEEQSQSIELCRALIEQSAWTKVRNILTNLREEDAEGIRRHVLAYAQAVLLKSDNERAGLVLEAFMEPFWNSGFPALVYACYSVVKN